MKQLLSFSHMLASHCSLPWNRLCLCLCHAHVNDALMIGWLIQVRLIYFRCDVTPTVPCEGPSVSRPCHLSLLTTRSCCFTQSAHSALHCVGFLHKRRQDACSSHSHSPQAPPTPLFTPLRPSGVKLWSGCIQGDVLVHTNYGPGCLLVSATETLAGGQTDGGV